MAVNPTSSTTTPYIAPTTDAGKAEETQKTAPATTDAAQVPSGYAQSGGNAVYVDKPAPGATSTAALSSARAQLDDNTPVSPFALAEVLFKLQKQIRDANLQQRLVDLEQQVTAIKSQAAKMKEAADKEYSAAKSSAYAQIAGGAMQAVLSGVAVRVLSTNANKVNFGATGDAARNAVSQAWSTWGQAASGLTTGVGQRVAADQTYEQRQREAEQKLAQADETKAQTAYQQNNEFAGNAAQLRKALIDLISTMADREYQTQNKISKDLA